MYILRPIQENDFAGLCDLAALATGLTTLPNDHKILEDKLYDSLKAFGPHVRKPGGESYLFVLEDVTAQKIVGVSGIISKTGGFEPFYTYKIRDEIYESKTLNIHRTVPVLHLVTNHNGPSEIFGLFLSPEYRRHGLSKLLSLARFLFVKIFPKRFDGTFISELRGVIGDDGKSPFWECVGKHFFNLDFYTADFLSGTGNKQFIEDLMPDHPIYIPLLPHQVQKVIGQVHQQTRPARKLLEDQGFVYDSEVDIFDAGPTVMCKTKSIKVVAQSAAGTAQITETFDKSQTPFLALVSNHKLDFKATQAPVVSVGKGEFLLTSDAARVLDVKSGDKVLCYPL